MVGIPALRIHFPGVSSSEDWDLYFAPNAGEAEDNEMPDSYVMLRQRNVLTDRPAEWSRWDKRILDCLQAEDRAT